MEKLLQFCHLSKLEISYSENHRSQVSLLARVLAGSIWISKQVTAIHLLLPVDKGTISQGILSADILQQNLVHEFHLLVCTCKTSTCSALTFMPTVVATQLPWRRDQLQIRNQPESRPLTAES